MVVLSGVWPLYTHTFQSNEFALNWLYFYFKSVKFLFLSSIFKPPLVASAAGDSAVVDSLLVVIAISFSFCLFVCFVALRSMSTAMVIARRSVHLTTLFPGQA